MAHHAPYHVPVDINNAAWVANGMAIAAKKEAGITRAILRVFEWVCWQTYIKFSVRLATYKIRSPGDGELHEYAPVQYNAYRANARNRTVSVDEEDDDSKFRLLNNYQFQLRLICWAEETLEDWKKHTRYPDNKYSEDMPGLLELSYLASQDDDGEFFYVPEFRLNIGFDTIDKLNVKSKQKIVQGVEWMATRIGSMFEGMPFVFDEERNVAAQLVLQRLTEEDERKYAQAQVEAFQKKQAQRRGRDHLGEHNRSMDEAHAHLARVSSPDRLDGQPVVDELDDHGLTCDAHPDDLMNKPFDEDNIPGMHGQFERADLHP